MTYTELKNLIDSIDSKNADYIIEDYNVLDKFHSLNRWENEYPTDAYILRDFGDDAETRCAQIADMVRRELVELIEKYDARHLTPANVKVGDGVTVRLWSDRHAATVIKVTKCSITVQQDKATLDPNFKPEWIVGGFAGHCTNQDEQTYTYERDPNGSIYTFRWSKKYGTYGTPGNLRLMKGRHEFYDYNF